MTSIPQSTDSSDADTAISHLTSVATDSITTNVRELNRMKLIKKYSDCQTLTYQKSTMQSINRAVRLVLLPRMKFVSSSKSFGSFEQPDFTDNNCWVHRVFDQLGTLKNAPVKKKAELWMTYRTKIKEQFNLHRSLVTQKLKTIFVKGKFVHCDMSYCKLLYSLVLCIL